MGFKRRRAEANAVTGSSWRTLAPTSEESGPSGDLAEKTKSYSGGKVSPDKH